MNTELVKSQLDLLKVLAIGKYRKAVLLKADKKLVVAICESIHNVLAGNINITETDRLRLKKFRKTLYELIDKSSLKTKKRILIQRGGFLQFLIPAVVSGLASIISSIISNNSEKTSQE